MTDQIETVTVTAETLPVIVHQDARVITTELLAILYGAKPKNIHDNFANNKDRFESGKQFKALHRPENFGSVEISPRVKELMLWTERGAARHAKMLDTDQTWEVFEQLEDAYFAPKTATLPPANPEEVLITISSSWKSYALFLEQKSGLNFRATSQLPRVIADFMSPGKADADD